MCGFWTHFKCSALTFKQFESLVINKSETLICNFRYDNTFTFNKFNTTELLLLNYCLTKENTKSDTEIELTAGCTLLQIT